MKFFFFYILSILLSLAHNKEFYLHYFLYFKSLFSFFFFSLEYPIYLFKRFFYISISYLLLLKVHFNLKAGKNPKNISYFFSLSSFFLLLSLTLIIFSFSCFCLYVPCISFHK